MFFLMGFITAFSQQASAGLQNSQQKSASEQQDRSTLSPNPAPGAQTELKNSGNSNGAELAMPDAEPKADAESSPNKPTDPAAPATTAASGKVYTNVENVGPRPNDPNGTRPETK